MEVFASTMMSTGANSRLRSDPQAKANRWRKACAKACFRKPSAKASDEAPLSRLLQLGVLRLGFFQDGDVGVGVFPEGEEIFVGGERPDAGGIGIRALRGSRLQSVGTGHSQMRQRSRPAVPDDAAVVENLLKLSGGFVALSG